MFFFYCFCIGVFFSNVDNGIVCRLKVVRMYMDLCYLYVFIIILIIIGNKMLLRVELEVINFVERFMCGGNYNLERVCEGMYRK